MKKYMYVRIKNDRIFSSRFEEHKEIIEKYALKGFSYVGFIPVKTSSFRTLKEIDLIFEIEV